MLFQLTDNVFIQDEADVPGVRVEWNALRGPAAADTDHLAHVVNFYKAGEADQRVQALSVDSVVRAVRSAPMQVRHLGISLAGEESSIKPPFQACSSLTRTVLDLKSFAAGRKLPLLFDILESGTASADPRGYVLFTNSDICLSPHFYASVRSLLEMGVDCLIINRRTVDSVGSYGVHPACGAFEMGKKHPGFDCFIFPVRWMSRFVRSDSCIGMPLVMRPLLHNLVAQANRMLILRSSPLTYHYGDDMTHGLPIYQDYHAHNQQQAQATMQTLCQDRQARERLRAFCVAHHEPISPPPEAEIR